MENQERPREKRALAKKIQIESLSLFLVGAAKHENHLELIADVVTSARIVGTESLVAHEPASKSKVARLLRNFKPQLAVFCGGTGIGPEDRTVEILRGLACFEIPGVGEVLRRDGLASTPNAIIGRGGAWVIGQTLCLALSSNESALKDQLAILSPYLEKLLMGVRGKCPSRTAASNQATSIHPPSKAGDQRADLS